MMRNIQIIFVLVFSLSFSLFAGKDGDGFRTPSKRRPRDDRQDILTPVQQRDLEEEEALQQAPRKRRVIAFADLNAEENEEAIEDANQEPLAPLNLDPRFEHVQILSDEEQARIDAIVEQNRWRGHIEAAIAIIIARFAHVQPNPCGQEIGHLGFMRF